MPSASLSSAACALSSYDQRSYLVVLYSCGGITKTSKEAAAEAFIKSVDLLLDLNSFDCRHRYLSTSAAAAA